MCACDRCDLSDHSTADHIASVSLRHSERTFSLCSARMQDFHCSLHRKACIVGARPSLPASASCDELRKYEYWGSRAAFWRSWQDEAAPQRHAGGRPSNIVNQHFQRCSSVYNSDHGLFNSIKSYVVKHFIAESHGRTLSKNPEDIKRCLVSHSVETLCHRIHHSLWST